MNTELTPKQLASEAIRQAQSILVVTGQHPNVDQVTALMALGAVLRKLDKKVSAIISDSVPAQLSFLPTQQIDKSLEGLRDFILKVDLSKAEVDKLKYGISDGKLNIHVTPFRGKFTPGDVTFDYGDFQYDLAIVLGVPTRSRIDRVISDNPQFFDSVPVVNIDFHRSNEQYGAINLIEPNASSLSEILVALAESLQNGVIDEPIATMLLTGIISSTDRYTASHTSAKSLTVSAQLMAAGAKQQEIVKALFRKGDRKAGDRPTSRTSERPSRPAASEQPRVETAPPAHSSLSGQTAPAGGPEPAVSADRQAPELPASPLDGLQDREQFKLPQSFSSVSPEA